MPNLTDAQRTSLNAMLHTGVSYREALALAKGGSGQDIPVVNGVGTVTADAVEVVPGAGGAATAIILRTDSGKRVKVTVDDDLTIHATDITAETPPQAPIITGPSLNEIGTDHLVWSWVTNQGELYTVQLFRHVDGTDLPIGTAFGPYTIGQVSSADLGAALVGGTTYVISVAATRDLQMAVGMSEPYVYGTAGPGWDPDAALAAPASLAAVSVTDTTVTLSWDAPAEAGASVLLDYIEGAVAPSAPHSSHEMSVDPGAPGAVAISGLNIAPATTYSFALWSVSGDGTRYSQTPAVITVTTGAGGPSGLPQVTDLVISQPGGAGLVHVDFTDAVFPALAVAVAYRTDRFPVSPTDVVNPYQCLIAGLPSADWPYGSPHFLNVGVGHYFVSVFTSDAAPTPPVSNPFPRSPTPAAMNGNLSAPLTGEVDVT
jgi:hypothetical protein